MRRAPKPALALCLLLVLTACGEDESTPARSAGTWDVDRNPRDDDCGLQRRGTTQWTITDGKALVLKIGREELVGEEVDGVATFRFDDAFDGGGCTYTGELNVVLTLSEDDQAFTGDLRGFLRYSSARVCGFAAIDGPIRCDMEVGVIGRRVAPPTD